MRKPEIMASKVLFAGRAVTLHIDDIVMPDGRKTTREIVEHLPAVAVVAVDAENNVLLVRQYREAVKQELLEIPAGGIDAGEDPETAVRREMQEETGFLPGKLVKLCGFYAAPGYCTEFMHVYLATDLTPGRLYAEDTSEISLVKAPVKEIPALLRSGKIIDAKSIAGLYAFLDYQKKLTKHKNQ
ncbi:MAG: NUDIX hydrolase [Dehalococcoidales bacterium]|nr:NUDIX hydrolase [Dehalococcoidales bacterium]